MSPSGKAAGSGPAIRGFESLHPSQIKDTSYFRPTRVFHNFLSWKTQKSRHISSGVGSFVVSIEAYLFGRPHRDKKNSIIKLTP